MFVWKKNITKFNQKHNIDSNSQCARSEIKSHKNLYNLSRENYSVSLTRENLQFKNYENSLSTGDRVELAPDKMLPIFIFHCDKRARLGTRTSEKKKGPRSKKQNLIFDEGLQTHLSRAGCAWHDDSKVQSVTT